ncbi:uncharacterized protein FTOL_01429 [Fusarium torulosum]|uniref:Ankyrin n=1 Tax=Fusarium torulosum TaxID=33205 RepID=A0AAE8SDP5_9HYPO|nr:uncharacterized protein FTOL_01429 [Fusarium torulosum]
MDEAGDFKSLAKTLISLRNPKSRIKTLVTSRNEVSIQRVFYDVRRISLEHHIIDIDEDIEHYVKARLIIDPDLEWLSPKVRNLVTDSLLAQSKGSFRWTTCQLDALCDCRTIREIKRSLERLPEGLNATYSRQLARLAPADITLVNRIMAWLSFSFVPITLHQLWEALAIEKGTAEIDDESRLRSSQDILLLGSSLINVSLDGYVMLSHLSVRDYLLSSEIRLNPATIGFALDMKTCHLNLAQDCLTYLMFSELSSGPSNIQEDYLLRLQKLPLLQYATRYWFYHARSAEYNEDLETLCHHFFSQGARQNFMSWVQTLNANAPLKWNIFPKHATSLYYAASLGLERVIAPLIQSSTVDELNAAGSRFGGTAIHAAALRDHRSIIEKLASAGADVNKADFNHVTPLHTAASRGSIETIKILLHYGASNEALDGMEGKTPANWARLSGHDSAARLIEVYGHISEHEKEIELYDSEESGGESDSKDCSRAIDVWQPGICYFPDYYERRSGLDCSCIIGLAIGEKTLVLDSSIALTDDGESPGKAMPVW